MKITGKTRVKLSECLDNEHDTLLKTDEFANIVGYLFNRNLIELPDEYWIEDDNGWKLNYYKNYFKIYRDFQTLTKYKYSVFIK